jgi:hypothetical protein
VSKSLFKVTGPYDDILSWIAWSPSLRTLRITWPWFWGTVGFDFKLRRRLQVYYVSGWREMELGRGQTHIKP